MNKIKGKDKSRGKNTVLKYREGNVVDFDINHIIRIASLYKLQVKQINKDTVEITNDKTKSCWYAENLQSHIRFLHKNQGSANIHSHFQKDFYDIDYMCRSISSHDIYKINSQNYRNSGLGKLFSLLESGEQKYIKIS